MHQAPDPAKSARAGTWRSGVAPALMIALGATLLRVLYLAFVCDYQLVEDEAHYWLWSRFPDWSYYSKGPGVAWAIALTTRTLGNAEWAVRLPTALLSGVGLCAVGLMMHQMASRAGGAASATRVAIYGVLALLLAPALQVVGVLMTIDGPYVACWACACLCAWLAMVRGVRGAWLGLGAALAAGFLFKYTMALLVPGLVLFAMLESRRTKAGQSMISLPRAPLAACIAIASAGLLPVVIWNAQHEWVTLRHLLGHLGLPGGDLPSLAPGAAPTQDRWSAVWSLEFIAQQFGMIGPLLVLGVLVVVSIVRSRRAAVGEGDRTPARAEAERFLLCCAAPILLFYLVVSFITEPEGNWPIAGYVTLLPLGAWHAADAVERVRAARSGADPAVRGSRAVRRLWRAGIWYGVVAALLVHFAGDVTATLNRLSGQAWFAQAFERVMSRPPRPIVLGRLYGAREMAREVDALLQSLEPRAGARQPFILAQHYGRASQMAYYFVRDPMIHLLRTTRDHPLPDPEVLCAMPQTGGRRSQFDLWAHTDLRRPDLRGRAAVILSNNRPETLAVWSRMFEAVSPAPDGGKLTGEHKADRFAFVARGYRGLAPAVDTPAASTPTSAP